MCESATFRRLCEEVSNVGERDNPISVRSKRRITESLLELMHDTPFAKISIKDIVERAGLTRQTFYHNFESKEEVLIHKEEELFEGLLQYLVDNRISDWENIIWFYFRYWQRNSDFVKLLINNNLVYILEAKYPEYFKLMQFVEFRETDLSDIEAEYVYSFVSGAIVNMLVSWIKTGMVMTAREMADLVMQILDGTVLKRNSHEPAILDTLQETKAPELTID